MFVFSSRLLSFLQLTRMALVFTAIADGASSIFLLPGLSHQDVALRLAAMTGVSVGLYAFGMSLNDIIDRRRDTQISPNRPLPSGRISLATAHILCAMLAILAVVSGALYASFSTPAEGRFTFVLIVGTGILITFYDFAGKYLVPLGLVSLGLIRFFHACIPAPQLPLLWHPLTLLNHVTLLSMVAYAWEQKRPSLTKRHVAAVAAMLATVNGVAISLVWWRRHPHDAGAFQGMGLSTQLIWPALACGLFVLIAIFIRRSTENSRVAGQRLMFVGLLWLIVYDATFVASHVGWKHGLAIAALLPVAYFSVRLMRWWSGILALVQRPQFKRAGI